MRLVSLSLQNIRSYPSAKLTFPDGIVLLSGDIGAGKSTVLLAIEFALFGVLRGELSGNALLRNGAMKGSVELTFSLDKETYTICRTLKRSKTSVEQESGYILSNGVKSEGTAIELKSKILELLGYPSELLTKAKNYVYRYTLYTPQEDMKNILTDTPEERLQLLRKVFSIDKYQRIADNAQTYTKALRERKRAVETLLVDLGERKKQRDTIALDIDASRTALTALQSPLTAARTQLGTLRTHVQTLELQRTQHEQKQRELLTSQTILSSKKTQKAQLERDIATLTEQLKTAPPPLSDVKELQQQRTALQTQKIQHESAIRTALMNARESSTLKMQSSQLATKIKTLANCPTCLQLVTDDHKHAIVTEETNKASALDLLSQEHERLAKTSEEHLRLVDTELQKIIAKERDAAVAQLAHSHHQANMARKKGLEQQDTQLNADIASFQQTLMKLDGELKTLTPPAALATLRLEHDTLAAKERDLSIKHGTLTQKIETLGKSLTLLSSDIERKEKAKGALERSQQVHHYLTDAFVPLMSHIEKHVLGKIHHEFDAIFSQWFSELASDLMTARLDETFTPKIQQNGYDTDIEHLSGGERTACALAYRLALNKTINSLINTIKTKDLLILDEPTDGFSSEQLDRMREVLAQLDLGQIIIVSHEQKIEGFADHVIRVQKNEHVSQIS